MLEQSGHFPSNSIIENKAVRSNKTKLSISVLVVLQGLDHSHPTEAFLWRLIILLSKRLDQLLHHLVLVVQLIKLAAGYVHC